MLQTWCCVVGSLVYLLASSCPCDAHTSLQPLKTRRTLETASSAAAPSLDSTNKVWHIGGNASLVSVSLDGLQKSTTNSSSLASFSQAPSQPGAKRRLLQSCSCVACANTQSIPALATYTLTFSSANVIDLNLQSTDGSSFLYSLSYQTGYDVDFGSGYSPTSQYTCTDVQNSLYSSCPTATSSLQITCANLVYPCPIEYDISAYADYSQCPNAPPPPQTSASTSSTSSGGCQCSCCLGYGCTSASVGTVSGVNDASSCTPDSCRSAYPSSCPAVGENGVVSSNYVASTSDTSASSDGSGTSGGKSGSCFPASAAVHTPHGARTMDSLRVGDQVLVSGLNGQAYFEKIFMFSHRNARKISEYLTLHTANNRSLTITPGHYLFVNKNKALKRAADAKPGDYVWTTMESHPNTSPLLMPTEIVGIQPSMQKGLYNPHTFSGTIIVNNVAATTFTDTIPPSFQAHTMLTLPAAFLFMILPSFVADCLNSCLLAIHFGFKPFFLASLGAMSKCGRPTLL